MAKLKLLIYFFLSALCSPQMLATHWPCLEALFNTSLTLNTSMNSRHPDHPTPPSPESSFVNEGGCQWSKPIENLTMDGREETHMLSCCERILDMSPWAEGSSLILYSSRIWQLSRAAMCNISRRWELGVGFPWLVTHYILRVRLYWQGRVLSPKSCFPVWLIGWDGRVLTVRCNIDLKQQRVRTKVVLAPTSKKKLPDPPSGKVPGDILQWNKGRLINKHKSGLNKCSEISSDDFSVSDACGGKFATVQLLKWKCNAQQLLQHVFLPLIGCCSKQLSTTHSYLHC